MSSCDDLFLERQRALEEQRKVEAELARIKMLGTTAEDLEKTQAKAADPTANAAVDEAIADPQAVSSRTNIPEGQPVNFKQQLRDNPADVVKNYANYSRALMETGKELSPKDWSFADGGAVEDAAKTIADAMGNGVTVGTVMKWMSSESTPFMGAVERTSRLRWWHDVSKQNYLQTAEDILQHVSDNPSVATPPELLSKMLDSYKVSLMAEREYDFVRNTWSRQGKAMQGKNFEGTLEFLPEDAPALRGEGVANEDVSIEDIRKIRAEDLTEEQSPSRLLGASDLNVSNPAEAIKQMELEINSIRVMGTDPRKRFDPKRVNDRRYRLINMLGKDSQLFNERTQTLNVGSNFAMAVLGPARKTWEGALYTPVGTTHMDAFMDSWQATWKSYGVALQALRASGKEAFMDAFKGDATFYSSNLDVYGKMQQPVAERIAELETLMDRKMAPGAFLNPMNIDNYRGRLHAGIRLWLHDKTGSAAALRPGLAVMTATDNAAGLFFHSFAYRHDLEMRARREGVQMGLVGVDPKASQRSIDDWVNQKYEEGFYHLQPSEDQIKAYRKEQGIAPEAMSDTAVAQEIMDTRVRQTYGAPAPINDDAMAAGNFSEEMRFQNKPSDLNMAQGLYQGLDAFRKNNHIADLQVKYLQAPFMGSSLDFTMTGIGPAFDFSRDYIGKMTGGRTMTPVEMRRAKANLIMAGHVWGIYSLLSVSGNIVGNGPTDPGARRKWLMELKAQGKSPNSIMGVPLVGGLPIVSSMFLLEDLRQGMEIASISDLDQANLGNAAITVLAGHLQRTTALGQVGQLLDMVYGQGSQDSKLKNAFDFAGYIGGGEVPGIGLIRSAERALGSQKGQLYQTPDYKPQEEELFDRGFLERAEDALRRAAYGVSGGFGLAGGAYKDKDWLGTDIRLPWGFGFKNYLTHRFFPHLHPEDKAYAELKNLDLLDPPQPLMIRNLDGVPMSDNLQKEYNDTYGAMKGDMAPAARLKLAGASPVFTIKLPVTIRTADGIRLKQDKTLVSLDMSVFLGKHVQGKTMLEATRSLMGDPVYKAMQANPATTGDVAVKDQTRAQARRAPAVKMMQALKNYYALLTEDAIYRSTSPDATEWRERAQIVADQNFRQGLEESSSFVKALSTAQ